MMEFVHPPVTLAADASDPNVLLAAGLRQVGSPAAASTHDHRRSPDNSAGIDSPFDKVIRHRTYDHRAVIGNTADHDDP